SLSRWVSPYPPGYDFPLPFGGRPSLLGTSCSRWRIGPSFRFAGCPRGSPNGVSTFRTVKMRPGRGPALPSRGAVSQEERASLPSAGYQGPAFPLVRSACQSLSPTTARPQHRFTCVHPSGLPLARSSLATGSSLGVAPRFGPGDYSPCPEELGTGL